MEKIFQILGKLTPGQIAAIVSLIELLSKAGGGGGGESGGPLPEPTPTPTPQPLPAPQPGDDEDILDPGPADPPEIGSVVLEVRGFQHKGRIMWPGSTQVDGQVVGDGTLFHEILQGRRPLNNRSKIMVTPSVFDRKGRELDSDEWDRLGLSWNIKYFAEVVPDPGNPESVTQGGVSGFEPEVLGEPDEMVISPSGAPVNVGGKKYRDSKGRSATYKVFAEGVWHFWAELPGVGKTTKVTLVVR